MVSRPLDNILQRLDAVRANSSGHTARCPAHDDRHNSLSVAEGEDGRVLLKCFAGCTVDAILAPIGLHPRDLFSPHTGGRGDDTPRCDAATVQPSAAGCTLAGYAEAKRLPLDFLRSLGLAEIRYFGQPAVRIPYPTTDGKEGPTRFRLALHRAEDGADNRFAWKKGSKLTLYGLDRLDAYRAKRSVLLVEGESDCHTGWLHRLNAIGLPGADNWNEARDAALFDGFDHIAIVIEPDKGGEAVKAWLGKSRIRDRAHLVSLGEHKDVSGLHLAHPDPDEFRAAFFAAVRASVPWSEYERQQADEARREAWACCAALATAPDILARFVAAQKARGIAGEERAQQLVYLGVTSRFLDRPVSIAVKGPSSGGKSYTTERTLDYFPAEAFYALSAMSERALAYSDEPLAHRVLVIFEAAGMGGDFATYLIRSLLSEGRIRYETIEKTRDGLQARLIEREGPTGLLVTTTATHLHPENETRLLSIPVTDTPEQTRQVFRAIAAGGGAAVDLAPWQALQSWLAGGEHRAVIPYADTLAELVPPVAVRLRRDFGLVLNLIRAHAVLHQATRQRDSEGRVIATLADYAAVRALVADLVAEGVEATVPATVRETIEAVKQARGVSDQPVRVSKVAELLRIDKSAASRRVAVALERGYLANDEPAKGKPSKLIIGDRLPEDVTILPTVEALREVLHGCSVDGGATRPLPPAAQQATDDCSRCVGAQ